MATTQHPAEEDLIQIAKRGVAEDFQKKDYQFHIRTPLDDQLENYMEEGKHVVLTGNPGDGKTQHISQLREAYPEEDGYFYETDASAADDYEAEILEGWKRAYNQGQGAVLAINEGPLFEIIEEYGASDEYEFLQVIKERIRSQLVFDSETNDWDDFIVINLDNRKVLLEEEVGTDNSVIEAVIQWLVSQITNTDQITDSHISYNAVKMDDKEVKKQFEDLLQSVGRRPTHTTIRDLLNYVAYCLTGGELSSSVEGVPNRLKYYNLAFDENGPGKISQILSIDYDPTELTTPLVDKALWLKTEEKIRESGSYDLDEVTELAGYLKRRLFFEQHARNIDNDEDFIEIDSEDWDEYTFLQNDNISLNTLNPEEMNLDIYGKGGSERSKVDDVVSKINHYFMRPENAPNNGLVLWFGHNYSSWDSQVLVSRNKANIQKFHFSVPELHQEIQKAINYDPDFYRLDYRSNESEVASIHIDNKLNESLNKLDIGVPYALRDKGEEKRIRRFMSGIEASMGYNESRAYPVRIKDTDTGETVSVNIDDEVYKI